uniref:Uncharacterized protein n=1 Tax=Oryza nivara TaxID=4536 RepID=A0A0E0H320_ORYNI
MWLKPSSVDASSSSLPTSSSVSTTSSPLWRDASARAAAPPPTSSRSRKITSRIHPAATAADRIGAALSSVAHADASAIHGGLPLPSVAVHFAVLCKDDEQWGRRWLYGPRDRMRVRDTMNAHAAWNRRWSAGRQSAKIE